MDGDGPTTSMSRSVSNAASGGTSEDGAVERETRNGQERKKRNAEGGHPEDPWRADRNWMRSERSKRKTVRHLETLERLEAEVTKENVEWYAEEPKVEAEAAELDHVQVRHGPVTRGG